jgi:hypothetical protein
VTVDRVSEVKFVGVKITSKYGQEGLDLTIYSR